MSVEIDPQYQEEIKKIELSGAVPEKTEVPTTPMDKVVELLRTLRSQEMLKTVIYKAGEDAWPEAFKINQILKELEGGETKKAREFLKQKATQAAEKYNILANSLEELGDRLAEARVQLEEDIRTAIEELSGVKAEFEAAKEDIDQRQEAAVKVMAAESKVNDLLSKQKENFQDVQQFIDAAESLGE